MGLTKITRLLLENILSRTGGKPLESFAGVASKFNEQDQLLEILATAAQELNQNMGGAEALLPLVQTARLPDIAGIGVAAVVKTITVPVDKTLPGSIYNGAVAVTVINLNGFPADVTAISILLGGSVVDPAVVTLPTQTLLAGAGTNYRIDVKFVRNSETEMNIVLTRVTAADATITVPVPLPNAPLAVAAGPLTLGLLLHMDIGVGVLGDGFFEIEAFPGTIV